MNIPTCITLTARSLREGPSPRDCFLDSADPLAAVQITNVFSADECRRVLQQADEMGFALEQTHISGPVYRLGPATTPNMLNRERYFPAVSAYEQVLEDIQSAAGVNVVERCTEALEDLFGSSIQVAEDDGRRLSSLVFRDIFQRVHMHTDRVWEKEGANDWMFSDWKSPSQYGVQTMVAVSSEGGRTILADDEGTPKTFIDRQIGDIVALDAANVQHAIEPAAGTGRRVTAAGFVGKSAEQDEYSMWG